MSIQPIELLADGLDRVGTPDEIIDGLPQSGAYTDHYQPTYESRDDLWGAINELRQTRGVTTPEHIMGFRQTLGQAALEGFVVLDASCAEPVRLGMPIHDLVDEAQTTDRAVRTSRIGQVLGPLLLRVKRNRGLGVKPRSNAVQTLTDEDATEAYQAGDQVPSFLGEGVNGEPISERRHDPSRMVAMAVQARDLEDQLTEALGYHLPAAHEALLLPYERAFVAADRDGRRYLLSADLPWAGARTNDPNGAHVELLSGIKNAVGVKIDGKSDTSHIRALAEKLNPNDEAGKLVFMMRLGAGKAEQLGNVLDAIHDHAPNAIIMYDIHGVTKSVNGEKIRSLPDIIGEIIELTTACNIRGLRMSGVHLETMGDDSENECIDREGERPTRPGYVDPRLNPRQLQYILDSIASTVLNQTLSTSVN